jgi:hypothetical protein
MSIYEVYKDFSHASDLLEYICEVYRDFSRASDLLEYICEVYKDVDPVPVTSWMST